MSKDRLSPETWIIAGLDRLAATGPNALRAEPLARHLGTTKGSFYWHFKNVPDFHRAVLGHWQSTAYQRVVTLIAAENPVGERLRRFGADVLADPVEPALRAWALTDQDVAEMLREVDKERLNYLGTIFAGLGITNRDYALAAYGSLLGLGQIGKRDEAEAGYVALVDLILALR